MAVTIDDPWNTLTPTGTDLVSEGDDRIRELKAALDERLRNAGINMLDGGSTANQSGYQMCDIHDTDIWRVYESSATTTAGPTAFELNENTKIARVGGGRSSNPYTIDVETGQCSDIDCDGTLTANLVQNVATVNNNVGISPTGAWAQMGTMALNLTTRATTAGPVLLIVNFAVLINVAGGDTSLGVRMTRNPGATIMATQSPIHANDPVLATVSNYSATMVWMDTLAAAGTPLTYAVEWINNNAGTITTVGDYSFSAIEFRNNV